MTQKYHFWYGGLSWPYLGQVWVSRPLGHGQDHKSKMLILPPGHQFNLVLLDYDQGHLKVKVILPSNCKCLTFGKWEVGLRLKRILVHKFFYFSLQLKDSNGSKCYHWIGFVRLNRWMLRIRIFRVIHQQNRTIQPVVSYLLSELPSPNCTKLLDRTGQTCMEYQVHWNMLGFKYN